MAVAAVFVVASWDDSVNRKLLYFALPKVRHLNVATFRQNVSLFSFRPALW